MSEHDALFWDVFQSCAEHHIDTCLGIASMRSIRHEAGSTATAPVSQSWGLNLLVVDISNSAAASSSCVDNTIITFTIVITFENLNYLRKLLT